MTNAAKKIIVLCIIAIMLSAMTVTVFAGKTETNVDSKTNTVVGEHQAEIDNIMYVRGPVVNGKPTYGLSDKSIFNQIMESKKPEELGKEVILEPIYSYITLPDKYGDCTVRDRDGRWHIYSILTREFSYTFGSDIEPFIGLVNGENDGLVSSLNIASKAYEQGEEFLSSYKLSTIDGDLCMIKNLSTEKYGYVSVREKKEIIPPVYEDISVISENLIAAKKNNKYGYIDRNNNVIIDFKYNKCNVFVNGFAIVSNGDESEKNPNNLGVVNKSGKEIVPLEYSGFLLVEDKYILVSKTIMSKNYYGLYSVNGGVVAEVIYDDITMEEDKTIYGVKDGFKKVIAVPSKPAPVTAKPTVSKILVNNKEIELEVYAINDNNYFKLRDTAKVVTGTTKQFEVIWDETKNAVNLISDKPYTSVGGELAKGDGKNKAATEYINDIYKDAEIIKLKAYTINGNNYFKLRDLCKLFNIGVTWDSSSNTISIDTSVDYTE